MESQCVFKTGSELLIINEMNGKAVNYNSILIIKSFCLHILDVLWCSFINNRLFLSLSKVRDNHKPKKLVLEQDTTKIWARGGAVLADFAEK